jgi:protein SCO1/2
MRKTLLLSAVVVLFLLSVAYGGYSLVKTLKAPPLPVLGQISNFKLIDMNNKEFSLNQLTGKVWVADFFFTSCSDICPVMTKNMKSIYESFKLEKDVNLVSITVNPEQDTPEILTKYASKFKIRDNNWHFLTGERSVIRDLLVNNFKLGDVEEPIFHSSYFALVDKHGFVRGYYDGTDKEAIAKLFKDTASLLKWN